MAEFESIPLSNRLNDLCPLKPAKRHELLRTSQARTHFSDPGDAQDAENLMLQPRPVCRHAWLTGFAGLSLVRKRLGNSA